MRRQSDVCPFHDICFDQQQKKWDDHAEEHKAMWRIIDASLPRWVFVLIISASIGILGAGFGFFGYAQHEQSKALTSISIGLEVLKQQHETAK